MKSIVIVGYSGHAFVAIEILNSASKRVIGYCENQEKKINPFELEYFGTEGSLSGFIALSHHDWFIGIGDNGVRKKIYNALITKGLHQPTIAIHATVCLSSKVEIQAGTMISAGVVVNALSEIGTGVIINTNATIEHECKIGDFVHIAPGAVLCGNVVVGEGSFVGANTVIKQGISVGKNVTIGAGSVVVKDIPDNSVVYGNPARLVNSK